jgi:predicted acylesterase/phospholipase RssA
MVLAEKEDFKNKVGWPPKVLVGTSIGATNAAVLACRDFHQPPKPEGLAHMWDALEKGACKMHCLFLRKYTGTGFCLFGRKPWKETLHNYASDKELQNLKPELKLFLVAFNVSDGVPVIYTNDRATQARLAGVSDHKGRVYECLDPIQGQFFSHLHVMASSAIPYIYRRIVIPPPPPGSQAGAGGGIQHWDGVLMYSTPLEPAIVARATHIIVILLMPMEITRDTNNKPLYIGANPKALLPRGGWPFKRAGQLLDLATIATFVDDWDEMVQQSKALKCILIYPEHWLKMLDIIKYKKGQIRELRKEGRQATRDAWARMNDSGYWDSGQPFK